MRAERWRGAVAQGLRMGVGTTHKVYFLWSSVATDRNWERSKAWSVNARHHANKILPLYMCHHLIRSFPRWLRFGEAKWSLRAANNESYRYRICARNAVSTAKRADVRVMETCFNFLKTKKNPKPDSARLRAMESSTSGRYLSGASVGKMRWALPGSYAADGTSRGADFSW